MIRKNLIAKRACAVMLSLAMALPAGIPSVSVQAAPEEDYRNAYEGYEFVWGDEFDGDTLNTQNWNVEAHEPGWVNAELQKYPDAESALGNNIVVTNGVLSIIPKAQKKENTGEGGSVTNLFSDGFDSWAGNEKLDSKTENGTAAVKIVDAGANPWEAQYQKTGLTLTEGHTYKLSMTTKSDVERKMQVNVTETATQTWPQFGQDTFVAGTEEAEHTLEFTMGKADDSAAAVQINFGKFEGEGEENSALATVTLSNLSLVDLTASEAGTVSYHDYDFTSGRINTENKHNFTYGMFETRAKVPAGKGYLPAFWLMAANENEDDEYGKWPTCGEIDMMEVLGDDTSTVHGTIHYGNPH